MVPPTSGTPCQNNRLLCYHNATLGKPRTYIMLQPLAYTRWHNNKVYQEGNNYGRFNVRKGSFKSAENRNGIY